MYQARIENWISGWEAADSGIAVDQSRSSVPKTSASDDCSATTAAEEVPTMSADEKLFRCHLPDQSILQYGTILFDPSDIPEALAFPLICHWICENVSSTVGLTKH